MTQNNQQQTPKNYLKTISILHIALVAGPLLLGTFFYLQTDVSTTSEDDMMIYIFPLLGVAGIFVGQFLFKQLTSKLKKDATLSSKLATYQTASLVRWALVEGPALLNFVWFGNTSNSLFLAIGATLLIYLFLLRPTKTKIQNDLKLQGPQLTQFTKTDHPLK